MGDGTKDNPYTRKDVLRLIKENGGKAEGLDLSNCKFVEAVDLSGLDLFGIILRGAEFRSKLESANIQPAIEERIIGANLRGTNLRCAQLERAYLLGAYLEQTDLSLANLKRIDLSLGHLEGASLWAAHLEKADLSYANLKEAYLVMSYLNGAVLQGAHLDGADLRTANLERADLASARLEGVLLYEANFSDARLEEVDWGNYILGEEESGSFEWAKDTYRRLKQWYTEHGIYDVAGKFFYREMEARRKAQSWKRKPHLKLWNWVLRLLCGYGEKPERVVISAIAVIFGLAAAYYFWGTFSSSSFWDTLYYSAASFVALGYGQWAPQPTGWAKGMGAAEAVMGVFMMALFLVTFTRKMTR
jgi:uncharacterized protein YjbI with pentapeptide repeats